MKIFSESVRARAGQAFGVLAVAGLVLSAKPALASIFYEYTLIAENGTAATGGAISDIKSEVSINEMGDVAFVATVGTLRQVLVGNAPTAPEVISLSPLGQNFDFPMINNQGRIVTRELHAGNTLIRVWDRNNPSASDPISDTRSTAFSQVTLPVISNSSGPLVPPRVPFLGRVADLDFGLYVNRDLRRNTQEAVSTLTGTTLTSFRSMAAADQPVIVAQYTGDNSSPQASVRRIVAFHEPGGVGIWEGTPIASTDSGQPWTELGVTPGISDSAQIIAFVARHAVDGEGIYIARSNNGFSSPVTPEKVIDVQTIIACDENGQPIYFQQFDFVNRIGVIHQIFGTPGFEDDVLTLAFVAKPTRASVPNSANTLRPLAFSQQNGLWTLRVDLERNLSGPAPRPIMVHPAGPIPVIQELDVVGGHTVEEVSIYDPLSEPERRPDGTAYQPGGADHFVAFSVKTSNGVKVVRGTHLDNDLDGLLDHWEVNGIDVDGDGFVELDLVAMGAQRDHKDLFLEIDWLADRWSGVPKPYSNRTAPFVANDLRFMFERAPRDNPDGVRGITLHIDAGMEFDSFFNPYSINFPQAPLPFDQTLFDGGQSIREPGNPDEHIDLIYHEWPGEVAVPAGVVGKSFFELKNRYFGRNDQRGREFVFKYAIMGDFHSLLPKHYVVVNGQKEPGPVYVGRVATASATGLVVDPVAPLPEEEIMARGGVLKITQGKGAGQLRRIGGRTASSLEITDPWVTIPDATSLFVIFNGSPGRAETYWWPSPENHGRPTNDLVLNFPANYDPIQGSWAGLNQIQWRVIAHELGHTFGLRHGGTDHVARGKGNNYRSIMHYDWQNAWQSTVQSYSDATDLTYNDWANIKFDFFRTTTQIGVTSRNCPFRLQPEEDDPPPPPVVPDPDLTPPTIVITSPVNADCSFVITPGSTLTVNAVASDNIQVTRVLILFDINGDGDYTDAGETVAPEFVISGGFFRAIYPNVTGPVGLRNIIAYAFDSSENPALFVTPVSAGTDAAGVQTITTQNGNFSAQPHQNAGGQRQKRVFTNLSVPSSGKVVMTVTATPALRQPNVTTEVRYDSQVEKIIVNGLEVPLRPACSSPGCTPSVCTAIWQAPRGGATFDVEVLGPARLDVNQISPSTPGAFLGAPLQDYSLKVTFQAVDITPPEITMTAPTADTFVETGDPVEVRVSVSDDFAIGGVSVSFDRNGDGDTADAGETVAATAVGGGVYRAQFGAVSGAAGTRSVRAVATDTAGLQTTTSGFIEIRLPDTTAPTVSIKAPPAAWPIKQGDSFLVEVFAFDDIQLESVEIKFDIDGNGNTTGTGETVIAPRTGINLYATTFASIGGATGPRNVQITARDKAGNTTPASLPVTVISAQPVTETIFTQNGTIPAQPGQFGGGSQQVVDFNPINIPRSGIVRFTVTAQPPVRNASQNIPRADPYVRWVRFGPQQQQFNLAPECNEFGANPAICSTSFETPSAGSLDFQILGPGQWNIFGEFEGHAAQNYNLVVTFTGTDHSLPVITVTSPALGAAHALNSPLTVDLTATDDVQLAAVVATFDVNGDGDLDDLGEQIAAASLGGNNYRASFGAVTGPPGGRTVVIQATDTSFNTARREHSVGVDGVGAGESLLLVRNGTIPGQSWQGSRQIVNINNVAIPGPGRVLLRVTASPNTRQVVTNLERHDPMVTKIWFNGQQINLTPVCNAPGSNPAYCVSSWDSPGAGTLNVELLGPATYNTFGEFDGTPTQEYQLDVAFFPGPTVTGVTPNTGSIAGHETVIVNGTGFANKPVVLFGDVAATATERLSATQIRCQTPPGVNGAVAVTVLNPDTSNTQHSFNYGSPYGLFGRLNNGFTYFTPGTTPISSRGERLIGTWRGQFAAVGSDQPQRQETHNFTLPAGGQVRFEVYAFVPIVNPIPGPFEDPTNLLWHNTSSAVTGIRDGRGVALPLGIEFTDISNPFAPVVADTTAQVPDNGGGTGNFTILGPAQWNAFWREFGDFVMLGAPAQTWAVAAWHVIPHTVASVTPSRASTTGGTLVTITGANFTSPATVHFGQHLATNVVVVNPTTLTVTTPVVFGPGVVDVTVTVDGRPATRESAFRFVTGTDFCVPAPEGLVSWWRGNNSAADARGPNHGTLKNGAAFGPGQVNEGFVLDGSNDFVEIPTIGMQIGGGDFTVDGWVKTTDTGTWNCLVAFDTYSPGLYLKNAGQLQLYPAGESPVTGFNDGQWHHFAAVRRNGTVTYYKDGVPAGTTPFPNGILPQTFQIGSSGPGGGFEFLQGTIDEVDFFNRALTAAEIGLIFIAGADGKCHHDSDNDGMWDEWEALYGFSSSTNDANGDRDGDGLSNVAEFQNYTLPGVADTDGDGATDGAEFAAGADPRNPLIYPPQAQALDLLAYWNFDDASNPTSSVDLARGYEGLFVAGAKFTGPGGGRTGVAADRAADFSGNNPDHMVVPNAVWLNVASLADKVTISFWQKLTAMTQGVSFHFNSPSSVPESRGAAAHSPWSDGVLYWDTAGCCGGNEQRIFIAPAVGFNFLQWHHYAYVKNGDTKEIWVDGQRLLRGTNTFNLPRDMNAFYLGSGGPTGWQMQGFMDEVAIFADALGTSQIQSLATGLSALDLVELPAGFRVNDVVVNPATRAVTVTWESQPQRTYTVQWSTDLAVWTSLQTGVPSQGAATTIVDTATAAGKSRLFYRVIEE